MFPGSVKHRYALPSSLAAVYFADFQPGNVKVAGLLTDIHATEQQFSTAVSIFYATYVTFEVCKSSSQIFVTHP